MVADLMTGLLRDSLQSTDFADADHRVGNWYHADFHGTAIVDRTNTTDDISDADLLALLTE